MESDLLKGYISAEEYFCLALTSESTPEKAQSSIKSFLNEIQRSHPQIYSSLRHVYDEYFLNNYHESFHEDDEDMKLAIEMSMLDVDLKKDHKQAQSCWGVKNPKIYHPQNVLPNESPPLEYNTKASYIDDDFSNPTVVGTMYPKEDIGPLKENNMTAPKNMAKNTSNSQSKNRKRRARKKQQDLNSPTLLWFRRDLRLFDNPALVAAAENLNGPIIPVFLWNDNEEGPLAAGGATKIWLHKSIEKLSESFIDHYQSKLILRKTQSYEVELHQLLKETGAKNLVFTALYEPFLAKRDNRIMKSLEAIGVKSHVFHSYLLHRPDQMCVNGVGFRGIGSVLHFLECCKQNPGDSIGQPIDKPKSLLLPEWWPRSHTLNELELGQMPVRKNGTIIDWAKEMRSWWTAGEEAGYQNLMDFLSENFVHYEKESARADRKWTAIISPYMHFGELSPRTVFHEACLKSKKFRRKLAWRDLSYWLLCLFPNMDKEPIRPPYAKQRWNLNKSDLKAWQKGNTGYPLVDAAMRQLWQIGWINNYMRHVVASFLISYLHITWVEGYKWFQDTLLDADVAINAMMWQNGGMSGLDHWNFVMHPVDAAMTCDPNGDYVRKWVPELACLPTEFIHQPWKCPTFTLQMNNIRLGQTYPNRIVVNLHEAREQSLADVTLLRRKHAHGYIDPHTGNDMIPVPLSLIADLTDSHEMQLDKLSGKNRLMIPLITRKEFKFRTAEPNSGENPFNPVLKGYVSRARDEEVMRLNKVDFTASTMNEFVTRAERFVDKSAEKDEEKRGRRRGHQQQRRTRGHDPFTSV